MARIGYARVSTLDQDTSLQFAALRSARCDRIVEEKVSAVKPRPKLDKLLSELRAGDELVIYKIDRLARSVRDLVRISEHVESVGARLRSMTEPIDVTTPMGRMALHMLGVVAEFERSLIRERCIAGQIEAVRKGKLIGRPSKLSLQEQNELIQLADCGIPLKDIGAAYGVCEGTVRRFHGIATGRIDRFTGIVRKSL
ncbi:DNA invertase Pin-like site-specific DNA recombinase [Comamonas odontotermitis]|uniref:DNA invertase Pin-like site-specific DNA recombinase n=1 Tax=Comamonas odontotermitis TaxID=379895 RepID=A0ABR6RJJ1_9BURK|nr:recombinase family protein [Comamonas odontotermitis]MBB6579327.1 DNA invertase Pin-like site-specific DNA recombinase [Comamonas odontotermitis]